MKQPWFRYRKLGYLRYAPRIYWPSSWQGWIVYALFGIVWIGGGNAILILMFPQSARSGWIAILALLATLAVAHYTIIRRTAEEAGKRPKKSN